MTKKITKPQRSVVYCNGLTLKIDSQSSEEKIIEFLDKQDFINSTLASSLCELTDGGARYILNAMCKTKMIKDVGVKRILINDGTRTINHISHLYSKYEWHKPRSKWNNSWHGKENV